MRFRILGCSSWVVVAACSGCFAAPAPPAPTFMLPPPMADAVPAKLDALPLPFAAAMLADTLTDTPFETGWYRVVHGPTACQHTGTNPEVIVDPPRIPLVGSAIRVHWSTRAGTLPLSPVEPTVLLVSLRPFPSPVSLTAQGMPGCWLLVAADYTVLPAWQQDPGVDVLFQQGGEVWWQQVLPQSLRGVTLRCQLVVRALSVNTGGYLLSPALEVHVGG